MTILLSSINAYPQCRVRIHKGPRPYISASVAHAVASTRTGPLNRRLGSCTWHTERFYVCLRRQQGAGLFLLGTDWSLEAEFLGDDVERRASSGIASWTTVIVRIAMSEQEP